MEKFRSLVVGLDLICQQLVLNAPAKAEATLLVGWLTVPKYKKKISKEKIQILKKIKTHLLLIDEFHKVLTSTHGTLLTGVD